MSHKSDLKTISIANVKLQSGCVLNINLSYQVFGRPLHQAPVILVNHALTGNSHVAGERGWWQSLIGFDKTICLHQYTVIAFNIPGNGYYEGNLIDDYKAFSTHDVANIFWQGLDFLKINHLFAAIGGSLGGAIAWEMAFIRPHGIQNLIPIACFYKANDWLIAQVHVQDQILNNSSNPVHDARLHAMLLYRHPESLTQKFKTQKQNSTLYQVESWLNHHGQKLTARFQLAAYKLMNYLLRTIGEHLEEADLINFAKITTTQIHQIAINTDLFFVPIEQQKVHDILINNGVNAKINYIISPHGHDAFLIEYQQLNEFLTPVFQPKNQTASILNQ